MKRSTSATKRDTKPASRKAIKRFDWLDIETVLKYEDEAAKRYVSVVARSRRGFLRAYEAVGGDVDAMARRRVPKINRVVMWDKFRDEFVSRTFAQYKLPGGATYNRWLALVMWAFLPPEYPSYGGNTVTQLTSHVQKKSSSGKRSLEYATLDSKHGIVSSKGAGTSLFVCAMHFKASAIRRDADSIRLFSMMRHTGAQSVFSIAHDEEPGVGYTQGDFSSRIPYVGVLKPNILCLDYNWCPIEYIRNRHRYNTNWFTGKVHNAMQESGAELFLLPNFIVYNEPKFDYMWRLFSGTAKSILELPKQIESFEKYNEKSGVLKMKYFMISRQEAETMHPLVRGTILADEQLQCTRNGGRGWAVHQKYVHPSKAFFVFYPAHKSEQDARSYLKKVAK